MKKSTLRYTWLKDEHGISLRPEQTTNAYPKDVSVRLQQLRQGIISGHRINLDDYHEAVLKWPDNPDAKLMLIGALFQTEREIEAQKWLETALREHPDNIYVIHASVQFCDTHDDAVKLGPIHGPNSSILDFPADKDGTYTQSERLSYYPLCGSFITVG